MREEDERYFERIESQLEDAFDVAERAKATGGDPKPEVEIPTARDMADRVENILGIDGVAERVRDLEGEMSREEAALALVEDFVEGTVGDYDSREGKVEGAVRTAVALLTEGVVAAPIEGIDRVELLENDDGSEFINIYYAGPIRSAGGTAQALSVLVADYARTLLGIDEFHARTNEVERYAEEVSLYDDETGLQYSPKDKETKFIAEHLPIMLDGEATGDEEVQGQRDLERIDTNSARGGMCLVLAEGIALKAPKIQRYTRGLDDVDWPWLQDLIDGTIGGDDGPDDTTDEADPGSEPASDDTDAATDDASTDPATDTESEDAPERPPRPEPSKKYLRDLIAGRPVFGHPSEQGGFRLRYGRARNHGFATAGVHPATMHLVDDFLATGTQIKTERPGKAAGVVPVDSIDGPTVRLANGDVRRIDDPAEAKEVRNGVESILDLGEYLVNYGEFVENNHPLSPASYTVEWWEQDLDATDCDVQALQDSPRVDLEDPPASAALDWATEYDAPLHPTYTYLWHDITVDEFETLADAVTDATVEPAVADGGQLTDDDPTTSDDTTDDPTTSDDTTDDHEPIDPDSPGVLVLERTDTTQSVLERLLVTHRQTDDELRIDDWVPLAHSLGIHPTRNTTTNAPNIRLERTWRTLPRDATRYADGDNAIRAANAVAPFTLQERAPTRIGNRMGRPEKSESRDLSPAVHTLFPVGEAGGSQRSVSDAATHAPDMRSTPGLIEADVGRRRCTDCNTETWRTRCPNCNTRTTPEYWCPSCEQDLEPDDAGRVHCNRCDRDGTSVEPTELDIDAIYRDARDTVGERENAFDILKGVKGLSSANKTPEPMEKGILRAKHGVTSFKDGTVRYDMTDLPVTAIRPRELDVTADQLKGLGYHEDIHGEPLTHDDQLLELKVQDVILSDGAAEHMLKTAAFVDDLLTQYYDLDAFYELDDRTDLVGELVFGMAPHTSAATVGRIVGFTSAAVGYAHPYFHAAKRRNCFHPETKVWFQDEHDEWHHDHIQRLVEDQLDPETADEDDFGALVQELDDDVHVPSLADDGRTVLKRVQAISKHVATDHVVEIETTSGSSLTVTPEHSMVVWDDGPTEVDARELDVGDELPVATFDTPNELPEPVPTRTDGGDPDIEIVDRIQVRRADVSNTYSLTVEETHRLVANGLHVGQCDGDEDCVMLLMDGLLNFSKSYLPDQRGGSVAEDSRLLAVDPDGNVRFMTFDEFWSELESPLDVAGKFRKRTIPHEGWQTYAFDQNHEASLQPIEKAIRYRADDDERLVQVETQFGRSIDVTENHSLFRYDATEGIEELAGSDLEPGDLLVAPRELAVEPSTTTIDVAEAVTDPYVVIDDHVEDLLRTVWENADRGDETRQLFERGISYRLSKSKIPYDRFETILDAGGFEMPPDVSIGLRGSSDGVRRCVDVDEDFAWLLGLYVAEGSTSSVCPTIHNSDEEIVDEACERIESTLDVDAGTRWSNRSYEIRFPAVFRKVLYHLGFANRESYNSSEKVIPEPILDAPEEIVQSFLRGFVAGDGSDSSDGNVTTVGFHTTSEDVKDGIVFLLHRLGLVANVSKKSNRKGNRQDIYTVTVSGGADDNPLHRVLDGEEPYHPKSLVVAIPDALRELREMDIPGIKQTIPKYLKRRDNISLEKLEEIVEEIQSKQLPDSAETRLESLHPLVDGDLAYLRITDVEHVDYDGYLYDLQVGGEPIFTTNWLYAHNSMDAPLVMSSRIDPSEIDDEAHNMDIMHNYPKEFYEATRNMADPETVTDIMTIAESTLNTNHEYTNFHHTHDTTNLALGPDLSAYKTLDSMEDKMDAQLHLSRNLHAVHETDVAERIIDGHFLPDLIGNLRAFARQETRCLDCGEKYRRMPLTATCRKCNGRVNLTVHQGSVNKYMQTAIDVANDFGCRPYTKHRLKKIELALESIFENDHNKQSGIADFM